MTMRECLNQLPAALKGFEAQAPNYQNWLVVFVSPALLLSKYVEAQNNEQALRAKYGDMLCNERLEYVTMRYAVEVLLTGNKLFYRTNPGTTYKPTTSDAEDQYTVDLLLLSYPLTRGFQSLTPEQQTYIREKYSPSQLFKCFTEGVQEDLKSTLGFANINAAQIATGLFIEYGDRLP